MYDLLRIEYPEPIDPADEAAVRAGLASDQPFQVPDTVTPLNRLAILDRLAFYAQQDPIVLDLARRLAARAVRGPGRARDFVEMALAATQDMGFKFDRDNQEWFQPVRWTIAEGGDCDDLSNALVALVCAGHTVARPPLHVDARSIWMNTGVTFNHVTVQVRFDPSPRWEWAETTLVGATLGEHPYAAVARLGGSHVLTGAKPGGPTLTLPAAQRSAAVLGAVAVSGDGTGATPIWKRPAVVAGVAAAGLLAAVAIMNRR